MEFLKSLVSTLFGLLKKGFDTLRGKNAEDLLKTGLKLLGGLAAAWCAGLSLKALHKARKNPGTTVRVGPGAKKNKNRTQRGKVRGKGGKKRPLALRIAKKVLLG